MSPQDCAHLDDRVHLLACKCVECDAGQQIPRRADNPSLLLLLLLLLLLVVVVVVAAAVAAVAAVSGNAGEVRQTTGRVLAGGVCERMV